MIRVRILLTAALAVSAAVAQTFDAATVQRSRPGTSESDTITVNPTRLSAHGVSVKTLIFEAYHIPYSQIAGGPGWIIDEAYDVDATTDQRSDGERMRAMLRALLAGRFQLAVHEEHKESRIYGLTLNKGGPKLERLKEGEEAPPRPKAAGMPDGCVCSMAQFAGLLAVKLTIPFADHPDPSQPSRATGPAIPVQDETGLAGRFALRVTLTPEAGGDAFALWQRALQDQLGLKLESRHGEVTLLHIDHVERPK